MKIIPMLLAGILLIGGATTSLGDEVRLRNGATLEGTVREEGTMVYVDVGSGEIGIDRSQVVSIHRPEQAIDEYDRRLEALRPDDLEGRYQLAIWARQSGLGARSERLFRSVLERDPNHEGARTALGFIPFKGGWLTPDQHKAAIGLVRVNGEWMPADAAERLRRSEQEVALAKLREANEQSRQEEELARERSRLGLQGRALDELIRQGRLDNLPNSPAGPWGAFRYWGPAVGQTPLPDAK